MLSLLPSILTLQARVETIYLEWTANPVSDTVQNRWRRWHGGKCAGGEGGDARTEPLRDRVMLRIQF